jgi:hypothetical protein
MTRPDSNDPNGSTRLGRDTPVTGTNTGADVTSRMTGTDRTVTERPHTPEHAVTTGRVDHDLHRDRHIERDIDTRSAYPADRDRHTGRYKTSAAAVFSLVFGLAALFCALTGILAPAAVVFGIVGLVLAFVGFKMAKRLGVTGKGVAVGGLITSLLGLLLGGAILAGAAVYVNDQGLDRLQQQFDNAVDNAPSGSELKNDVEGALP